MTIKLLELVHFEGYSNAVIEFDPGVNVITGLTGHGKSTLVRALRWVLGNEPAGEEMLSWFAEGKDTSSTVEFEDGKWISRIRGEKFNGYEVSTKEKPFKALRGDVPDEVLRISNMSVETNIQKQSAFYFMLLNTPGQVARMFNKVSGLEEMDTAQQIINSKCSNLKADMTTLSNSCDSLEETIKDLSWAIDADREYAVIEDLEAVYQLKEKTISEISLAVAEVKAVDRELATLPDISALPFIEEIFEVEGKMHDAMEECDDLTDLIKSILSIDQELKGIILPDDSLIALADTILEQIEQNNLLKGRISTLIAEIQACDKEICALDGMISNGEEDIALLIKEGGVCEVCKGTGMKLS